MGGLFRPVEPFLQNLAWQNQAQNALQYNAAQPGSVVPLIFGTVRQPVNVVDLQGYMGPSGKKGKVGPLPLGGTNPLAGGSFGGGSKKAQKASPYSVNVMFLLCEGPADNGGGNNNVYANAQVASFAGLGDLNFYSGTDGQQGDPVFASFGDTVNYSGTCMVSATPMLLGQSPVLPNMSFELNGYDFTTGGPSFPVDANPGNAVTTFLTDPEVGCGFPAVNLDDLLPSGGRNNTYGDYCQAALLLISTSLDAQQKASDWIEGLAKLTNSAIVWSGDLLRIVPYGDVPLSGNGGVWNPDLVPVYSLTDSDFIPWHPHEEGQEDPTPGQDDPILVTRTNTADAINWLSIQYRDRANFYDQNIIAVFDQASIDTYGRRTGDNLNGRAFCNATSAQVSAQLLLQRLQYVRNIYKFQLAWKHSRLEPMDIVLLTGRGGDDYLVEQPARVLSIEENENGNLTIEAEQVTVGVPAPKGGGPPPSALFVDGWTNGQILVMGAGTTGPLVAANTTTLGVGPLTTTQYNDVIIMLLSAEVPQPTSGHFYPAPVVAGIEGAGLNWQPLFTTGATPIAEGGNSTVGDIAAVEVWYAIAPAPLAGAMFAVTYESPVRSASIGCFAVAGANTAAPFGPMASAFNSSYPPLATPLAIGVQPPSAPALVFGFFAGYTNPVLSYALETPAPWAMLGRVDGGPVSSPGWVDCGFNYVGANIGAWNQCVGDYAVFQDTAPVNVVFDTAAGNWIGVAGSVVALGGGGGGGGPPAVPVITLNPTAPQILDTTPLGSIVATIAISMSDGSTYKGAAPVFAGPNGDDGGRFVITGPAGGPGPYDLVLNPAGPGLPASMSTENVTLSATQI